MHRENAAAGIDKHTHFVSCGYTNATTPRGSSLLEANGVCVCLCVCSLPLVHMGRSCRIILLFFLRRLFSSVENTNVGHKKWNYCCWSAAMSFNPPGVFFGMWIFCSTDFLVFTSLCHQVQTFCHSTNLHILHRVQQIPQLLFIQSFVPIPARK